MDSFTIQLDKETVTLVNQKGEIIFQVYCKGSKYDPEMCKAFGELLETFIVSRFMPVEQK